MLKFTETQIVFKELQNEVSLAINISNCPFSCKGCHSPHLQQDIGEILNKDSLTKLINKFSGITTILFMGGDGDINSIEELAIFIKRTTPLKVGWFSGQNNFPNVNLSYFDYIKLGEYIEELGGLDSPTTNQKIYTKNEFK